MARKKNQRTSTTNERQISAVALVIWDRKFHSLCFGLLHFIIQNRVRTSTRDEFQSTTCCMFFFSLKTLLIWDETQQHTERKSCAASPSHLPLLHRRNLIMSQKEQSFAATRNWNSLRLDSEAHTQQRMNVNMTRPLEDMEYHHHAHVQHNSLSQSSRWVGEERIRVEEEIILEEIFALKLSGIRGARAANVCNFQ